MTDKQTILVMIEFENDPRGVTERAAWLASRMDCDLELFLCDSSASPMGKGFLLTHEAEVMLAEIRQAQQDLLTDLVNLSGQHGVAASTRILAERPVADAIRQYAADNEPRMIVKGTHFHSTAERSIIVGTDWQLIRKCRQPLYLVKRQSLAEKPVIVAAVDPTHEHDKPAALDQAIVDQAQTIAALADGDVHLFHSYERLGPIGAAANRALKSGKLPIDKIDQRIRGEHRAALDALATQNGIDKEHTHQLPGRCNELLPVFVRTHKVDLVVMGALARWGLRRMVIGSTAERVLDHLPCDLLIVRPE